MTPQGTTQTIHIRPGLAIYKQQLGPGRGSPYWYARVHMQLGRRYINAISTRTTDVREAIRRAEDFWAQCKLQSLTGPVSAKAIQERRFDRVAEHWLDEVKASAGRDERQLRNWQDYRQAYFAKNGLAAFFKGTDVGDIKTADVRRFLQFAIEHSKKGELAQSTQRRFVVYLNLILLNACERGLISHIPPMPKIKVRDNPRPWFSRKEYRRLYCMAWLRARSERAAGNMEAYHRWMEVADFVIFMVGAFLRPSEWASIQNKHVAAIGGDKPHVKIAAIRGKTGARTVVSLPSSLAAYRRMKSRVGSEPEAFVFLPAFANRTTARERMRDLFLELTQLAGLREDSFGKARTSGCLRHSAIMFALLNGVTISLVAKNAGTSVEMIERFYGSHLTVEMKIDELHRTCHPD